MRYDNDLENFILLLSLRRTIKLIIMIVTWWYKGQFRKLGSRNTLFGKKDNLVLAMQLSC